jgi:glutathione S-transferase
MGASRGSPPKLYVILGSHACRTGLLLLQHKGISFTKVTVRTGAQRMLPLRGFDGGTVPALEMGERRSQGNRTIARFLDDLQPDPPLFPADPGQRSRVEEAEGFGDEEFQMAARRLILGASMLGPDAIVERGDDGPLGPLLWRDTRTRARMAPIVGRVAFNVNRRTERKLLAEVPAQLDRIDAWVEAGVLGGERLYAADYMLATSWSLLTYRRDLVADLERRPAFAWARRVVVPPG